MTARAAYFGIAAIGGVFIWSGVKGRSISGTLRQLAGGDDPNAANKVNQIATVNPTPVSSTQSTGASSVQAERMLLFMESQVGHPYLSQNPQRFGPTYYDCSGLVYTAAQYAGVGLPKASAIADLEAIWFAGQPGAQKITSINAVETGDICFFTGAAPDSNYEFPPIGHVGMCSSPGQLVSAYDTAMGVCYVPLSQGGGFVVAIRLA